MVGRVEVVDIDGGVAVLLPDAPEVLDPGAGVPLGLHLAVAVLGLRGDNLDDYDDLVGAAGVSSNTLKNYLGTTGRRSGSTSVDSLADIAAPRMGPAELIGRAVAIQGRG